MKLILSIEAPDNLRAEDDIENTLQDMYTDLADVIKWPIREFIIHGLEIVAEPYDIEISVKLS